jgi:hypothetical protein
MRRLFLLAGLALVVAGCAGDVSQTAGERTADEPGVVLAASTQTLEEESFRFEMTAGDLISADGAVDPATDAGTVTVTLAQDGMAMDFESIVVGTEMWTNLGDLGGLLGVDSPWLHIDQTRLGEEGFAGIEPAQLDLVGAAELLRSLGNVEQVDEHTFRGEIEVAPGESTNFADRLLEELEVESLTLEFVATVDDQDRLTTLVVDLPRTERIPAEQLELRYFDFGAPVEVSPPPADQVTELPEAFYDMFS